MALAVEVICQPVSPKAIQVDGLLTDWRGVDAISLSPWPTGGRLGPSDLSVQVRCNHDAQVFYLAVDVSDENFVRNPGRVNGDSLLVRLGNVRIALLPGDAESVGDRTRVLSGKRIRGFLWHSTRRKGGYRVEMAIPQRTYPGYAWGAVSAPLHLIINDSDHWRGRVETKAPFALKLVKSQMQSDLVSMLRSVGANRKSIRSRYRVNVAGDERVEEVLLVGRTIGIVGEALPGGAYFYANLPVRAADVSWIKTIDLNGDGRFEIVARFTERATNGSRELVAVYRFDDRNKFVRPFVHEVAKIQRSRYVRNRLRFRKWKSRKQRGVDIVVDRPTAVGFDQHTFKETPDQAVHSILLPWMAKQRRVFRFTGETYAER